MAITNRPEDKFAFLFTGRTDARYLEDLKNVFKTITEYYNYPTIDPPDVLASNIWVVSGDSALSASDFPGANLVNISDADELQAAFEIFANAASTPPPSDMNTALLYFTGGGSSGTLHLNPSGSVTIDNTWLTARLNGTYNGNMLGINCHINVVMQQSYSGGFDNVFSSAFFCQQWSFTSACGSTETVDTDGDDTYGSFFTYAWTMGLQLQKMPSTSTNNAGKYADELTPVGEQLIVSMKQARNFADEYCDEVSALNISSNPPDCSTFGDSQQYLGKPAFLIRDGDQQTPQEAMHESPDIYINSEGNDLYNEGDNNVFIRVNNNGTHPVRTFWIGAKHFGSGLGSTDALIIENPGQPTALSPILKPGGVFIHSYILTYDPLGATHRCIRARATLDEIVATSLDEYADWAYTINDFEAQRNIDPVPAPPPQEPPPAPDEANDPPQDPPPEPEPEPDPDPDAEQPDQTGGGAESIKNIRGFKEHIYHIKNPFKEKRRFLLAFPDVYDKYRELFDIKWFELVDDVKKELLPLRILDKPYKHIPFDIESGENKKILFYLAMKQKVEFKEKIKLPFEILIEKPKNKVPNLRIPVIKAFRPTHVPISGLTVAIKQAAGTISASVWNIEKKPLPGALLFIRTVNDRQVTVVRTGKSGTIIMRNINPDGYKIFVETDRWHSATKFVNLKERDELKIDFFEKESIPGKSIKVILDKIRILDDHDPCLKGKGELTFTTVVVADKDDKKKQIRRLPEKGVYRVGDKPGKNDIDLGVTIFEGSASELLSIGISGKEIDFFDRNDDLSRYYRSFRGDPKKWYGKYQPGDEYLDKENVGDWQVWYRIVRM